MATFNVSVIIPPHRFVTREKVDALCMYHAFLQMSHRYKPLHNRGVIYKCEYAGKYHYYDSDGKRLKA